MNRPDKLTATSPMAEAELRLGIEPIECLLDERSALVEKVADLRARFGSFGTFDHIRKMELARLAGLVRAQALRDRVKMTASEVEDATHDHPDYRHLITEATRQRAEWVRLEAKIEAIEFQIQRGQAVARFVTAEARI